MFLDIQIIVNPELTAEVQSRCYINDALTYLVETCKLTGFRMLQTSALQVVVSLSSSHLIVSLWCKLAFRNCPVSFKEVDAELHCGLIQGCIQPCSGDGASLAWLDC